MDHTTQPSCNSLKKRPRTHMAGEIHPKPSSLCATLSILEHLGAARGFCALWQVAPLWRDEDETPNFLLSCLQPCRLLEDFLEDISIMDRAGKLS